MNAQVSLIINQLKKYKPEKIILFGSYAYGKPNKDSDVDIVLIKETDKSFHNRQKEARMLLRTITPVDLFVFTPKEFQQKKKSNPLLKEIATRGKVIHG